MKDDAHIIDIDQIVLTGTDPHEFVRTRGLIADAVQRALAGTELNSLLDGKKHGARIGGAVEHSVTQALEGRE